MIMRTALNSAFRLQVLGMVMVLFLAACSSPRPVLYPNAYLNQVGQDQAELDIAECRQLADEHISPHAGEKIATNTAIVPSPIQPRAKLDRVMPN